MNLTIIVSNVGQVMEFQEKFYFVLKLFFVVVVVLNNEWFSTFHLQGIYDHKLGRYLRYDEELTVPIIENTPFEKDLEDRMNATMQEYPGSTAILVRRHGQFKIFYSKQLTFHSKWLH